MSFFSKITESIDKLGIGDKKKEEEPQPQAHSERGEYGYHGPSQGGPPPAQYQAAPPAPAYQPPSDRPGLPPGWIAQFDQNNQRWYYVEQATGRSQWEAPAPQHGDGSRGFGDHSSHGGPPHDPYGGQYGGQHGGQHGGYGGAPGAGYGAPGSGYGAPGSGYPSQEQHKSNKSGMLMGAAGGLAVGAVGGALVADALDDSDEEHHAAAPAAAPPAQYGGYSDPGYGQPPPPDPGYADPAADDGPPAVLPPTDEDGDSVSSSDREDVQEAREDYEEALAEANDSDASSSDREEAEEAREEYEEEYEEVYED